jgi:hypothetical protein
MRTTLPPFYSPSEGWPGLRLSIDQEYFETVEGNRFHAQKVFSNFNIAVPLYTLFENPADSGVVVMLQERKLKTDSSGLSSFQILWDYDVSTAIKTTMPKFNQNNYYRTSKPGKVEVSVLTGVTVPSPDLGDWVLTATPAVIIDDGIQREGDFIQTAGLGSNTSGDIAPDLGVRIYKPGTGFLTRMVTESNDNKVLWGYDWFEIPLDRFNKLYE